MVTRPLVVVPFWVILETTGMLVFRLRADVADIVDGSDVVLDDLDEFKDAKSSGDP